MLTRSYAATATSSVELTILDSGVYRSSSSLTPSLGYHLYIPERHARNGRILVSVHGVSRNAAEHIELFRQFADQYDVMLVVPHFTREAFSDYQRLGRRGRGPRADLALIRVLNEVGRYTGCDTSRVDLFGFSGGAQFAHRFAFAHPQRVRRLGLGAAGWYTMPDRSASYPYGIADAEGLNAVRFQALAISRLKALVLVGQLDSSEDDEELNRSKIVRRMQGENRLERAQIWAATMNACSLKHGSCAGVELAVLPQIAHSFRQAVLQGGMAHRLFDYLYETPKPFNWSRVAQGKGGPVEDGRVEIDC